MTIEPPPAETISLAAAARLLKVDGKSPSPVTLWRWARKGKNGIKLRCWKRGRTLCTTPEAVREFDAAIAEADAARWAEHEAEQQQAHPRAEQIEARAAALGV